MYCRPAGVMSGGRSEEFLRLNGEMSERLMKRRLEDGRPRIGLTDENRALLQANLFVCREPGAGGLQSAIQASAPTAAATAAARQRCNSPMPVGAISGTREASKPVWKGVAVTELAVETRAASRRISQRRAPMTVDEKDGNSK